MHQFAFWESNSPLFWKFFQENTIGFFEDDGEIALSRLSSLTTSNPYKHSVDTVAKAFRFQKVAKLDISSIKMKDIQVCLLYSLCYSNL